MSSLDRLRKNNKYKSMGKPKRHCHNCTRFEHKDNYAGVEGMSVDACNLHRVKEDSEAGVIYLPTDYGVCNEYD